MQSFLKTILNYRKQSEAIHKGKTIHFAPENGVYVISRISDDEKIVLILNKNDESYNLDLERFNELGLQNSEMKNLISEEKINWNNTLELPERGIYFYTTKFN